MKKIYFALMALCLFPTANAQIVNFPDANFKAQLLLATPSNYIAYNLGNTPFKIDANSNGEIEVAEAQMVSKLIVPHTNIFSLEGIRYFTNLRELNCSYTQITTLNLSGLTNLRELNCEGSQLTSINLEGLTNLEVFSCSENQLSSLNLTGLTSLKNFVCSGNQLSSLNLAGLTNLYSLRCENNQLTSLNLSGLSNLDEAYCGSNQLTSLTLNGLPNLRNLNCRNNQFTSLDLSGLTDLIGLYCGGNRLTSLNLNVLPNLVNLECDNNQFTSLNLSSLTNLAYMDCSNNQFTSLNLNGLTNLGLLHCHHNQLTSLDFNGHPNLYYLDCSDNQITSLNLINAANLTELLCENNQLTSLDLNDLASLYNLNCSNNPLEYLFLKNNSDEYYVDYDDPANDSPIFRFNNIPNLRYICADDFQVNAIQNKVNEYGYTNCHVNTYCSFVPGGEFYTIQGNYKFDGNNNGCDVSDSAFQNLKFRISDGTNSGTFISDTSGNYTVAVQAGTHTITPILENPAYFNVSPSLVNVTFPTQASPFTQDFCVTANGVHPDLEVTFLPLRPARPGFDAKYKLVYKNKGNQTQSGSVNLTFNDDVLDLVTVNPVTTNQTVNNLIWDFTNLKPYETREITITLNVNSPTETPAVNNGDVLNYTATITSAATDETPNDNTFALNQKVVNSFDPNDKTCLQGAAIAPSGVGKYVHYLIRFENTGTFPAENIVVKDIIDTSKFDINSLVPMKGSHPFVTNITSGNKVEFIFENINLPFDDANNDGYLVFKIKTKPTLAVGNTFTNKASIYFDYNFPIVTNTATTAIQALSTQDFSFATYFMLYPNPVKDVLNIETKQTIEVSSINIYNQLGQLVLVVPNAQNVSKVDVSSMASGNYFIKINSDKGTSNTKFIKK
ncbi:MULTISPECIES: DUF7619 domain-containing protein [Flavobacterium]|uniref:DUF7619 domain-containing protein n=1 Tax=Flavobacterium TaxID=237 RepID=UPI001FCC5750|nr:MULTISPECIES: leucine-rich repeat domain-containing protein [Flavobacterium]UOK41854.1 T9SS type A sorting domain-containing protein [Flavobacterium enshiense]